MYVRFCDKVQTPDLSFIQIMVLPEEVNAQTGHDIVIEFPFHALNRHFKGKCVITIPLAGDKDEKQETEKRDSITQC